MKDVESSFRTLLSICIGLMLGTIIPMGCQMTHIEKIMVKIEKHLEQSK